MLESTHGAPFAQDDSFGCGAGKNNGKSNRRSFTAFRMTALVVQDDSIGCGAGKNNSKSNRRSFTAFRMTALVVQDDSAGCSG
jgi:hypothetical protein